MKKRKVTKHRGNQTHGWGAKKKHRGAGNRGGRGNAGSGKRADQKKPAYWNDKKPMRKGQKPGQAYFGKHGFHSLDNTVVRVLNVRQLDQIISVWAAEKKVQKSGDTYTVDLAAVGIDKLLGTGSITKKVKLSVRYASTGAVEKIAAAGGAVTLTDVKAAPKAAKKAADEE